ncbi:hypothetical protein B0H17DRAFT_535405 [Mycena rosella]|uniref:F-box domain-containing protein n=1 Tax=Mycena rosella TaxID=1033263 RepID=A0AAD7BVM2_MYCRO|nr:hypothetical protein B0H17DRAFT_535405 [Mycena rosella]
MALACLAFMPPELQLLTYSEFHPQDLLSISHVSKFWRSLALEDKRWNEWFNLISTDDETAEAFLSRYRVLDLIPKRAIVTLCFYTKCLECAGYTTDIFLPLLQVRVQLPYYPVIPDISDSVSVPTAVATRNTQ